MKSEIRISNSETNPNFQMFKFPKLFSVLVGRIFENWKIVSNFVLCVSGLIGKTGV